MPKWTEEELEGKLTENPELSPCPLSFDKGKGNPLPVLASILTKKHKYIESEAEFLNLVVELAHLKGWLVAHSRPAWSSKGYRTPIQGDKGFFDLVLVRRTPEGFSDIIFAELKSEKGRLTKEQQEWLDVLKLNPTTQCFVWRPSDWQEIISVLR